MSKDYVSRRRQTKQRPNAPRRLVAIVGAFLCGYLVANVFDFTSLTAWVNKNILASKETNTHVEARVAHKEAPKPKFEFYTLLSKDSSAPALPNRGLPQTQAAVKPVTPQSAAVIAQPAVGTAQTAVQPAARVVTMPHATAITVAHATSKAVVVSEKKAMPASPANRESYMIQIASFNKRQDAEHLKASLVLRGFNVVISSIQRQTVIWYRVTIGPFNSRTDAEKAQVIVRQSEHMSGIIRRIG